MKLKYAITFFFLFAVLPGCKKEKTKSFPSYTKQMAGNHFWHGKYHTFGRTPSGIFDVIHDPYSTDASITVLDNEHIIVGFLPYDTLKLMDHNETDKTLTYVYSAVGIDTFFDSAVFQYNKNIIRYHADHSFPGVGTIYELETP